MSSRKYRARESLKPKPWIFRLSEERSKMLHLESFWLPAGLVPRNCCKVSNAELWKKLRKIKFKCGYFSLHTSLECGRNIFAVTLSICANKIHLTIKCSHSFDGAKRVLSSEHSHLNTTQRNNNPLTICTSGALRAETHARNLITWEIDKATFDRNCKTTLGGCLLSPRSW